MQHLLRVSATAILAAVISTSLSLPAHAQEQYQFESDLVAKRRLYSEVGAALARCAEDQ